MDEWYFAYGSNLWIEQVVERTGAIRQGDDRPRIARLPNYRLVFQKLGTDGQVFANIVSPGAGVLGVIYRFSPEAFQKMDGYEQGYERRKLLATLESNEQREVVAYVANPADFTERVPSPAYLAKILRGARQHGFPDESIRAIEAIAAGKIVEK